MAGRYKTGDKVYIISAGRVIEEVRVLKYAGGFYTIRFPSGGGSKLRENRLFLTDAMYGTLSRLSETTGVELPVFEA